MDRTPEVRWTQDVLATPDPATPQSFYRGVGENERPIPVRFPSDVLHEVKWRAEAQDRSVASWIRRAVGHELNRTA
jgi:hypothetical protein